MVKLSRKEVKNQLLSLIKIFSFPTAKKCLKITKANPKQFKKDEPDTIQGSIDALRVGIKYLVFAIEADRRENESLKKLLDDNEIKYPKRK